MADDRSLDEFLGGGSNDSADGADKGEASGRPEPGEVSNGDDDAPEPARSTVAFDPNGAACDACGATVRRRWRDGGELVCGDCKTW